MKSESANPSNPFRSQLRPKRSVRVQALGTADKIRNLRSILSSPPLDWNFQRQRDYFDWAEQVVDGDPGVNEVLEAGVRQNVYDAFQTFVQLKSATSKRTPEFYGRIGCSERNSDFAGVVGKMEDHDVCDDDYWKNLDGRRGRERDARFAAAMNRLDELSRKLTEESYHEYLKAEERQKEDAGKETP